MQIKKNHSMLIILCLINIYLQSFANILLQKTPHTIMINPAGDARNPGRLIDDNFERSITLTCAQELKNTLEKTDPSISVIVTRFAGQTIPELQNANFANRVNADLFLSLHFYQETDVRPHMFIYQFCYQPHLREKVTDLTFYSFDKAYLFNQDASANWAQTYHTICSQNQYAKLFHVHAPIKLPCEPLIGITRPALMLEFGIKKKEDWRTYVKPITETILSFLYPNNNGLAAPSPQPDTVPPTISTTQSDNSPSTPSIAQPDTVPSTQTPLSTQPNPPSTQAITQPENTPPIPSIAQSDSAPPTQIALLIQPINITNQYY